MYPDQTMCSHGEFLSLSWDPGVAHIAAGFAESNTSAAAALTTPHHVPARLTLILTRAIYKRE
jgi:hypothetical protein